MSLRDIMAADLAAIHADSEFCPAETVTWTPANGGTAIPDVKLVFDSEGRGEGESAVGVHSVELARCFPTVAQVPVVTIGDTMTRTGIGGASETWAVVDIASETPTVRDVLVKKLTRAGLIGPGDRLNISRASG